MAKKYTAAEWNALQASLPVEDRMTYAEYIGLLENFKAVEAASGVPVAVLVDEQTKADGAKTDKAAQKTVTTTSGVNTNTIAGINAASNPAQTSTTSTAQQTADDEYATKIVKDGLTQAQLDALEGQKSAADAKKTAETLTAQAANGGGSVVTTGNKSPQQIEADRLQEIANKSKAEADRLAKEAADKAAISAGYGDKLKKIKEIQDILANGGTLTDEQYALIGLKPPKKVIPVDGDTKDGDTKDGDGVTKYTATDGTVFTDQAAYVQYQKFLSDKKLTADANNAAAAAERQSAYDLLYAQFSQYGLGSLVEPLRGLIQSGASPAEFTIKLRESEAYKKRFAANAQRVAKGLKAIGEAEYLGLEDQYQNILRNAGLPESYWKRGDLGVQDGFTNFIANDVSAVELEDRVSTAQQRVLYANPEVSIALKTFYPDISNGDLLAYALDPTKGLEQIKRRITAAEVGSSAVQMGLATNVTDAEYLARYGVNKATAQQGYGTIAGGLQRGSQLASMYGENPYTQTTAEREVFNVPGAQESRAQRQKLTGLEKATFGGQTGLSQGALARDRAGGF
jgi:hypothetical protein